MTDSEESIQSVSRRLDILEQQVLYHNEQQEKELSKINEQLADITAFIKESYASQKVSTRVYENHESQLKVLEEDLDDLRADYKKWMYGVAIIILTIIFNEIAKFI